MSRLAHIYACYYYNKGLERAKVRDISGAVTMLRRSLAFDKRYINARNLLGLCLFEVGEVGEALFQWSISKSISKINPLADYYVNALKNNPVRLSVYKTTIRRFNNALSVMKKGGDDLALIQLKKAVSRNPNYVRAWQLLALLYMRNDDFTRARKCLKRTLKNDIANPLSLRYLKSMSQVKKQTSDLSVSLSEPAAEDMNAKEILDGSKAKQSFKPRFSYEESKPDYRVFVSLMAGILLGIVVVYYLIVPGVRQNSKQELRNRETQYGTELAGYLTKQDSLEKENSSLQQKLEMEQLEKESVKEQMEAVQAEKYYDNIVGAYAYYIQITEKEGGAGEMDLYLMKQKLQVITDKELESSSAKFLYDRIIKALPGVMDATVSTETLLAEGKKLQDAKDYAGAVKYLSMANDQSPDNQEVLYLLGRNYQLSGDNSKAVTYYRQYIEKYPEGTYAATVKQWIDSIE